MKDVDIYSSSGASRHSLRQVFGPPGRGGATCSIENLNPTPEILDFPMRPDVPKIMAGVSKEKKNYAGTQKSVHKHELQLNLSEQRNKERRRREPGGIASERYLWTCSELASPSGAIMRSDFLFSKRALKGLTHATDVSY